MTARATMAAFMILALCCGGGSGERCEDRRFVVLGPSLVELMFVSGLGDRIAGVDRFSSWPQEAESIPSVGGYMDPSLETIASLEPTSLHMVGESAQLREFCRETGIPFYTYRFDNLQEIYQSLDSLDSRYGTGAGDFKAEIETTLDSLRRELAGHVPLSVMVVVYHETGSGSMTLAGDMTFFADLLRSMGCTPAAPSTGSWPMVSAEGALELDPDHIICLYPGIEDTASAVSSEEEYWGALGFGEDRVH
ncbi:MAG: ABC transporter substrate-binding protein, partial [Candidatus Aegiribacteria sp.]|nr:ABC transporter substrate-binding protein [Candidatus Aegiribacteria sp.]